MSDISSNIRVFVRWKEQIVFAGENVECNITFKNIALAPGTPEPRTLSSRPNGFAPGGERQRKTTPHQVPNNSLRSTPLQSPRSPPMSGRGHRPTLSLNVPIGPGRGRTGSSPWGSSQDTARGSGHKHQRSVSIISLGGSEVGVEEHQGPGSSNADKRPPRPHGRSASLHVVPRRGGPNGGVSSPGLRSATQPSPQLPSNPSSIPESPAGAINEILTRPSRRVSGIATAPNTPGLGFPHHRPSGSFSQDYKFPPASYSSNSSRPEPGQEPDSARSPKSMRSSGWRRSPRAPEESPNSTEHLAPVTKVLSGSSMNGTPRSSAELYSVSNNSTETLASDYAQSSNRLLPRGPHVRKPSNLGPTNHDRLPETLMMGYIQIMGSFILDGSLINQAPFEEVKRKGVVGGQGGGGVVGLENKRDSGLFGAFGWGNIGESIGGLLGTGEMSSIKEMRGVANSKTVPLISTPQSVLFVDLRLAPGESKTYSYSFTLPRGLPPSHKGKAMKISYNMVVGVQRPVSAREQQPVTHVDVPFRVFGGVNGRGETLGHDLMSPHIILKDEARTALVDEGPLTPNPRRGSERIPKRDASQAAFDSFNDYISALLTHNDADPTSSLLSPTSNVPRLRHRSSAFEPPTPASSKEAIDLAILRSNITGPSSNFTPNRFEIARSSQRVAVLTLARPAYRLGETITAIIDFDDARIPTYAVYATLETMETVDPAIALRSPASVLRATRKMHAELSETTLYARRVVFAAAIPASATPDFITSGVSMKWKLRVQFVTPRLSALETTLPHEDADGSDDGTEEPSHISSSGGLPLLEEISTDQRGTILAAVEGLSCESFEVAVPVRVYGAVTGGGSGLGTGAGAGVGKEDGGRWGSGGGEGFAV